MTHKTTSHIFPSDEIRLRRKSKEQLLNQNGVVIWLTGLSGSGKTTIALKLEKQLLSKGYMTAILDGDNVRDGLCQDLSFSPEDRSESIRRISEVAALMCSSGIITICSFISPFRKMRQSAKEIIGKADFIEVYVKTPLEVCEKRDPKGLYKKARAGIIPEFTGVSAAYERPPNADIELNTENHSTEECCSIILKYLQLD